MGNRFEISRAADRMGMRFRRLVSDSESPPVRKFRRDKFRSEKNSPRRSTGQEKKAKVQDRDHRREIRDDRDITPIPQEPLIAAEPLSSNGNGHREPLVWEFDPVEAVGPSHVMGINPGEVYTLYDSAEPELALPEGGFHYVDETGHFSDPPPRLGAEEGL